MGQNDRLLRAAGGEGRGLLLDAIILGSSRDWTLRGFVMGIRSVVNFNSGLHIRFWDALSGI